jgi:hypothetical protein
MSSNSIHLSADDIISFFLMTEWNSIVYVYQIFLIHSSVVGHLGCSHSLAIVNSAAINIDVQESWHTFFQKYAQEWYHRIVWQF